MAVELEIRDGDPWWLSPDIWVVPGNDPLGSPGTPVVGMPAYMWARVRNNGETAVTNAEVRFYWADPSTGFDRTTANQVGSAFVTLGPGEQTEVLLLVPWVPEFVNNGHECILAEAFHAFADPLPASPAFNVPTDRHVAQRNLTVVQASTMGFFSSALTQVNTSRLETRFRLVAATTPLEALKPVLHSLKLDLDLSRESGSIKKLGFVDHPCPTADDLKRKHSADIALEISGHGKTRRSLIGQLSGGAALIHVKQYHGERLIGGQSVLVLPPAKAESAQPKPKKKSPRRTAS